MGHTVTFEYKKTSVSVDVWDDDKTASIEIVSSKYRKRGLATKLMWCALDYIDMLNLETVLEVYPFGEGHIPDKAELKAWYMTFGFKLEGDDVMARPAKLHRDFPKECNE